VTQRILIVDDDDDARMLLEHFAVAEGFAPITAASGEEALLVLGGLLPDLILLDAVMPGLDGFETCRQIKATLSAAHTPVIFMTGLSETEHVVQGLSAGGVDYVTKPLALDELAARIRVHIGNAQTARSALSALDSAGTRFLAGDDNGRILWATPAAQHLLDEMDLSSVDLMREHLRDLAAASDRTAATFACGGARLSITLLGRTAAGEPLFKLSRSSEGLEASLLQRAFRLTPREAHVLLWTARGKSNKDMSDILNISARTVNKHLEQIFLKIGVENRASAASAATRVLVEALA
jgi:DNA-binding response OmpR family regulator